MHQRSLIESFARLTQTLRPDALGLYVSGSVLREDFDAARSDIDLTVLVDDQAEALELRLRFAVMEYAREFPDLPPLDVRVLPSEPLSLLNRHQLGRHSVPLFGHAIEAPPGSPDAPELLAVMRELAAKALKHGATAEPRS